MGAATDETLVVSTEGEVVRVDHFTVEERVARGKQARADVRRSSHADWEPPPHRPDPGRAARGAGEDACAGARADPLRADARLAVHVLPRRRLPDGVRSRRDAAHGSAHAALRRRAPVELRRLRGARPPARLQRQRLRRDAARAVRVGREAARRELRRRRPRPWLRRRRRASRSTARWRARTASGCSEFAAMGNLALWYARIDVERRSREVARAGDREGASSGSRRTSPRRGRRTA